jgi:hypothetical protein
MRMLEGDAVGMGPAEPDRITPQCPELGGSARRPGIGEFSGHEGDPVRIEIMNADPGSLVGVGHGEAPFQGPFPDPSDGAVNPPRPGGCSRDDAGVFRIEGIRNLQPIRTAPRSFAVVGHAKILPAGNHALAPDGGAVRGNARAEKTAVSARLGQIRQTSPMVVD